MFAISFDLLTEVAAAAHPKGLSGAYREIERVLSGFSFERIQGSLYVTRKEDLANLFLAIAALKNLTWFPEAVRDIRAFRIDLWSDMTAFAKQ